MYPRVRFRHSYNTFDVSHRNRQTTSCLQKSIKPSLFFQVFVFNVFYVYQRFLSQLAVDIRNFVLVHVLQFRMNVFPGVNDVFFQHFLGYRQFVFGFKGGGVFVFLRGVVAYVWRYHKSRGVIWKNSNKKISYYTIMQLIYTVIHDEQPTRRILIVRFMNMNILLCSLF